MQHTSSYLIAIIIGRGNNFQQVIYLVRTKLLQYDITFPKIAI